MRSPLHVSLAFISCLYKVDSPYLVTFLVRTPIFGVAPTMVSYRYVFRKIGLCAQNVITILGSIVNLFGGVCMII